MVIMCEKVEDVDKLSLRAIEKSPEEVETLPKSSCRATFFNGVIAFCKTNEFVILVILSIALAKVYPPLGADYLQPQITAKWIAIMIIFLLAGLALRTDEFFTAFRKVYFNAFVQVFNYGVVSSIVFGFSRLMIEMGAISKVLGDGIAISGCLPITVNMCIVLTKAAGGDEALAIFNTAFSNMMGIFLCPILIVGYVGVTGEVPIGTTFYQLSLRVLLPIVVGQVLQKVSTIVAAFVERFKPYFLKGQEYSLLFILYTTFCKTFSKPRDTKLTEIFLMILFQFILLSFVSVLAWFSLRALFRDEPKLRVMGVFGCTHKTIAAGIPLVTTIYAGDPNLTLYMLPMLIWYPMQLILGSLFVPKLQVFVASENERLGLIVEDEIEVKSPDLELQKDDVVPDEEQPKEVTLPLEQEQAIIEYIISKEA